MTNLINGKIYVGITSDPRRRELEHRKCGYSTSNNKYLYNAIRKYGESNFRFDTVAALKLRSEAASAEINLIKELDLNNKSKGYNISSGGESGNAGVKLSEKQREKLSEARRGSKNKLSKLTEEIVSKLRRDYSASNDVEFIAKQSEKLGVTQVCLYSAIRGRSWKHVKEPIGNRTIPKSKETCDKISKARMGNNNALGSKNPGAKLTEKDVVYIKKYYAKNPTSQTIKELEEKFPLTYKGIYQIVSGKRWKHVKVNL